VNVYTYALNNPLVEIDPLGLIPPNWNYRALVNPGRFENPFQSRSPFDIRDEGFAVADAHPLSEGDSEFKNNFRHCYTSCVYARARGEAEAKLAGDANEALTGESGLCDSTDDSTTDQHYNEVGRGIARGATSDSECISKCTSAAMGN
jgi:hypothetical protein